MENQTLHGGVRKHFVKKEKNRGKQKEGVVGGNEKANERDREREE